MTSNPFEALNLGDNVVGAASVIRLVQWQSWCECLKKNKEVNIVDEHSDNDVIEDDNETSWFIDPKYPKSTSTSFGGGGSGKLSLYEHWKESYEDNPYDESIPRSNF